MRAKTVQALEMSIKHWADNLALARAGDVEDITLSPNSCALCWLFFWDGPGWRNGCDGCPVFERTGQTRCFGSPYYEVQECCDAIARSRCGPIERAELLVKLVRACERQLDFLVSLRE